MVEAGAKSEEELTIEDGLSMQQLNSAVQPPELGKMQPASAQQEAELQADNWKCERGSKLTCVTEPAWPDDIGELPPRLLEDSIVQAALTFPRGLGLGWDGVHPRVLARVSNFLFRWIASVMLHCEKTGK